MLARIMKQTNRILTWMFVFIAMTLAIYELHSHQNVPNIKRAVEHQVTGLDNSSEPFSYVVFSDPQFGLLDMIENDGQGIIWDRDINNMKKLVHHINALDPKPAFVFCTGDLSNAYPELDRTEYGHIEQGFRAPFRVPQTVDLLNSLSLIDSTIPILVNAGNHDLTENPKFIHLDAFSRVWGETYYYFWIKGHLFIALETQLFRASDEESLKLLEAEEAWIDSLFKTLPKETPKTVMMHAPLFIDNASETDSDKAKAIPSYRRKKLLNMFCENNVDLIYSGHTHMTNEPALHNCGKHMLKQIILTSVNAQLDWKSETKYYPIGQPEFIHTKIDNNRHIRFIKLNS